MYHVTTRWLGGTLTNYQTVRQSIGELTHLQEIEKDGTIEKYSKKEAAIFRKKRSKLEKNLLGIQQMPGLPAALFVVDAGREDIAVREARRLKIPCIGVIDTNCDPDDVDLPIPGNDDAIRAINLYCKLMADAVIEGKLRAEKINAEKEDARRARREGADSDKEVHAPETPAAPAVSPEDAYDAAYAADADTAEVAGAAEADENA
jgi:small subunit ribosomal protein S2